VEQYLNDTTASPFELYTTPPREVLETPIAAEKKRARNEDPFSLSDLHLVPAATLYVAWTNRSPAILNGTS
jgi:hypothetical protein